LDALRHAEEAAGSTHPEDLSSNHDEK